MSDVLCFSDELLPQCKGFWGCNKWSVNVSWGMRWFSKLNLKVFYNKLLVRKVLSTQKVIPMGLFQWGWSISLLPNFTFRETLRFSYVVIIGKNKEQCLYRRSKHPFWPYNTVVLLQFPCHWIISPTVWTVPQGVFRGETNKRTIMSVPFSQIYSKEHWLCSKLHTTTQNTVQKWSPIKHAFNDLVC